MGIGAYSLVEDRQGFIPYSLGFGYKGGQKMGMIHEQLFRSIDQFKS